MVIRESLISLLEKKPLSRITIKELCENAEINRATFYTHYADQYDLMTQIENELIDGIRRYLDKCTYQLPGNDLRKALGKILEYVKENAKICSILLNDTSSRDFENKIMALVQEQFVADHKNHKDFDKEDLEYFYAFTAIGSVGIIHQWLNGGIQKSVEELTELIMNLSIYGLSYIYGRCGDSL